VFSTVVIGHGKVSMRPVGHAASSDKDQGVSAGMADRGACSSGERPYGGVPGPGGAPMRIAACPA
jgi:hypothetical protein